MGHELGNVPLGHHAVTNLRRASTICVVRDGPRYEVLMVQRPETSRFMPSVWVFPGGAVDDADADPPDAFGEANDWKVAALRELMEETGLWLTSNGTVNSDVTGDAFDAVVAAGVTLQPEALIYFSNWVTPEPFPIRFDTRFFLTVADPGFDGKVDGDELVDITWIEPLDALRLAEQGTFDVAFPTHKTLELLATEATAVAMADRLRAIGVVAPVQPRIEVTNEIARIVLPGDPAFDALGPEQSDPDILVRLTRVVRKGGRIPTEFKGRR